MSTDTQKKQLLAVRLLGVVTIVLLVVMYVSPIWWVSLTAPNYPAETFPDGVRIHFHMNGVFNGCELVQTEEKYEAEALDCVHEMDAINHFVGMYPIASGGVVEKGFSPFLTALLGIMAFGFIIHRPKVRMPVMGVLFAGTAAWMGMWYYGDGGIKYQTPGYIQAMVVSLGQGEAEAGEPLSPIIAELRQSLEESGQAGVEAGDLTRSLEEKGQASLGAAISSLHEGSGAGKNRRSLKEILAEAEPGEEMSKEAGVEILRQAFLANQARKPAEERKEWTGSGKQVLFWHYEEALGRWFNNPEEIGPLVSTMKTAGTVVFWGIIAAMVFLVVAGAKNRWPLYWILPLGPIVLPIGFIVEYASWLWWYGHSLNEMGAFTLKPFMPTVFGQGKVAQFATHSYPHYGFGLMVAIAVLMLLAALLRRKQLRAEAAE